MMEWGIWLATGCLILIGLLGTVVPVIPGHLLIFLGALIPFLSLDDSGGVDWWGLIALGAGIAVAQGCELLSGAVGSRWFGGTKWGAFGAIIGSFVGLFFLPFGLLLGPLAGAFFCEWAFADQKVKPATVSGVGSVLGTLGGMVVNLVIGVAMVAVFLLDIFFW